MTHSSAVIHSLFIYPLKGAQAISLETMDIVETGPRWDREWMLIDEANDFLSQRKKTQLCLIEQQIVGEKLRFTAPQMGSIEVPMNEYSDSLIELTIFAEKTQGSHVGTFFDQWFSDYFSQKVKLIRAPSKGGRQVSKKYSSQNQTMNFPDGFPFLLTSLSTLDELNSKLSRPVAMNRFRPNIVIKGALANQEDSWRSYSIDDIDFLSVKACSRCVVVSVEQESGIKSNEPLKTLAQYRMPNGKILFGQNLVHKNQGQVHVGDSLKNINCKNEHSS